MAFSTAPLGSDVDVVGIPSATLHLRASAVPAPGVALFAKLYDVAPDGSVTLVNRLVSPFRVADLSQPVTVALPGIAHRFPAGHRLQFVVADSDAAYAGNPSALAVSVLTDAARPGTLTIPAVAGASALIPAAAAPTAGSTAQPAAGPASSGSASAGPGTDASGRTVNARGRLAATGGDALLPTAAGVLLLLAGALAAARPRSACHG